MCYCEPELGAIERFSSEIGNQVEAVEFLSLYLLRSKVLGTFSLRVFFLK